MENPSKSAWIIGATATVAGFAAGYFMRARDVFRPGPGHVYRIGELFFADDALVRRVRHEFPKSVVPRPSGGLLITPPGCYSVSLRPWDASSRLPKQSGSVYQLTGLREDSLRQVIEDWERSGFVLFVGAWSAWPASPDIAPDEWAPSEDQ